MSGTVVYKKNHPVTRINATAMLNNAPLPLALKTIEAKLENGDNLVELSIGSGIGLLAGDGQFWHEVTAANLTALGNPAQVTLTLNIWNADNSLAMTGTGVVAVEL